MILIGADENGLGPWLGPLVVTGVKAHMPQASSHKEAIRNLRQSAPLAHKLGINDSKTTSHFQKMQHCESIALGLLAMLDGVAPTSFDGLVNRVSVSALQALQAICPSGTWPQCWAQNISLPAWHGDAQRGAEAIRRWSQSAGVALHEVTSTIICVKRFNEALTQKLSKSHVNLDGFESVIDALLPREDCRLQVVCGRNGAMKSYAPHFKKIKILQTDMSETSKCSEYALGPQARIRFEVNVDSLDPLVGLASMLGKYIRELWMLRSNRFYQSFAPSLPSVSGYRDPKTRDWIQRTALLRDTLGIEPSCFFRTR